jgi:hypothetical protein
LFFSFVPIVIFASLGFITQDFCQDTVYAYVRFDTLFIHHDYAEYPCFGTAEHSRVIVQDSTIDVIEIWSWFSFEQCICCFKFIFPVMGLSPGTYHVRVWNEDQTQLFGETWVEVLAGEVFALGGLWQSPCLSDVCGDANGDGTVNASDITYLANYLYSSGYPPLCLFDPTGDGLWNSSDLVYLANYLFSDGPAPCQ